MKLDHGIRYYLYDLLLYYQNHMRTGSGRRNLRDCNVHIKSDRVSPTYHYDPYYISKLKACGGNLVRSRLIVVLLKLEDAVSAREWSTSHT